MRRCEKRMTERGDSGLNLANKNNMENITCTSVNVEYSLSFESCGVIFHLS